MLGYYALFRARRYRATRTIFRGVRFWMTGSGWAYVGRAILWDLLTVLTLGFAYAWRSAALERYKMRHTRYGDLQGAFVGDRLDALQARRLDLGDLSRPRRRSSAFSCVPAGLALGDS